MSNNQRSIDSKREEFRKYLESAGVTDAIIRILTMVLETEERSIDPLQFVRDQFVQSSPITFELQMTQKYLESAREKLKALESENALLREELESYKSKFHPKPQSSSDKH